MFDTLFSFIDTNPIEEDWFHFIAHVEPLLESPEQFLAEYEKVGIACLDPDEERKKKLDVYIGLSLIGQQGREQLYERLRVIYERHRQE